ncbi:MAG: ABC transporter permease [Dehalococcoidia bacterium]
MNDLLGIPMSTMLTVLLALLAVCLMSVAWIAWRRPVIFKLGVRNIPRRRAQTTLIVAGLMLSTLIIAAALGTGDTVNHSITADVYTNLGQVDELIVASHDGEARTDLLAGESLNPTALATVGQAAAAGVTIDGLLPMLDVRVPVRHEATQLAEPAAVLTGLDPARLSDFGGLKDTSGRSIDLAALPVDAVVLSEKLAEELEAKLGDRVTVFVGDTPHDLSVAAVAENSYLGGTRRSRGTYREVPGMAMPLANLQTLLQRPDEITAIAVSNSGDGRAGYQQSEATSVGLRAALSGTGLGVDEIKRDRVDDAEQIGTSFTTIFVVLGLFSIASGVLLIVLIFTMLASERRAEMGMERAVGTQRPQLIQQFVAEGSGYALVAGLVGAALGVLAAIGIAQGMKLIFGAYAPVEPHITPRSMVVAYCLGMVITFAAVVGSSWKISRINVVAAIRDIPDVSSPARKLSTLVWAGLPLAGGALLTLMGAGSENGMLFGAGMNLWPFGVALILRFFGVPARAVFSAVGLYILGYWLMPERLFESLFGTYDTEIAIFFVSGIFMVIGATILVINNTDMLLAGISRLGGFFRGALPAIRTAVAYPAAARGRTGMTIAMFSLIVFSLVMMATMSANFSNLTQGDEANAGWHIRADAVSGRSLDNLTAALQAQGVDTARFTATGVVTNPNEYNSEARVAGAADPAWKNYPVFGMNRDFIEKSTLLFQQRAEGFDSDADVVAALLTQPNVAVVDSLALPQTGDIGGDPDQFALKGLKSTEKVFAPRQIELVDPRTGEPRSITVIGVLDSTISSLYGIYANQATIDAIYGPPTVTSYFAALDTPDEATRVAREVESALLSAGVQAASIHDELKDAQKEQAGFLYIIQGFMGLGLLVGVAAIGVIAFRSVVERRQQIGMLRAIGFPTELVSLSFLIESAFVVGIGALCGTLLGLPLGYKLFTNEAGSSADVTFVIPWTIIGTVLIATIAVALLMTWLPSRQAGRIAPAEALRYE